MQLNHSMYHHTFQTYCLFILRRSRNFGGDWLRHSARIHVKRTATKQQKKAQNSGASDVCKKIKKKRVEKKKETDYERNCLRRRKESNAAASIHSGNGRRRLIPPVNSAKMKLRTLLNPDKKLYDLHQSYLNKFE